MASKPKEKKIATVADLRAKFGRPPTEFIDTGILTINDLWGGGLPTGKYVEIYSDPGLGKTTIALQVAMSLMGQGYAVGFMDVEHALDKSLKDSMGVTPYEDQTDPSGCPMFLHLSPNTYSEVEETTELMLSMNFKLIIFDSLTQAVVDTRKEGSIIDVRPGQKAMMQSLYLEQYKAVLARTGKTMIIINQMRTKISFIRTTTVEPAGGKSLQFNMDIRTGLRRTAWYETDIEGVKQNAGIVLEMITIKNKLTVPFRKVSSTLIFGKGIDTTMSIANLLQEKEIVVQKGPYFKLPDDTTVQGRVLYYQWVKDNADLVRKLLGTDTTTQLEGSDPHQKPDEAVVIKSDDAVIS